MIKYCTKMSSINFGDNYISIERKDKYIQLLKYLDLPISQNISNYLQFFGL